MKPLIIYLVILFTIFTSCANENSNSTSNLNNDTTETSSSSTATTSITKISTPDAIDARAAALAMLKPLSLEQLKALFPEEIKGVKRSDFNGLSTGVAYASAKYITDENTNLEILIQDCGGKAGPGIYKSHYAIVNNSAFAVENENGYMKKIDFKGEDATEMYDKEKNLVELNFIANDRLFVTIKGKNYTPEQVKEIAQALPFDQ